MNLLGSSVTSAKLPLLLTPLAYIQSKGSDQLDLIFQ